MATKTAKRKPARRKPTEAQIEARKQVATDLHESLAVQVEALASSAEWKRYLETLKAFRRYSFQNTLLIQAQCPTATRVAGFRVWEGLGRNVRKGEKAIKIFGYSSRKITEKDEQGHDTEKRIPFYPVLSVFDVSQTDGEPLADITANLNAEDTAEITDRVSVWLRSEGWTVESGDTEPAEGWTNHSAKVVRISDKLDPASAASVLLHEAAHVVLHEDLTPADYQQHRGVAEVEAESVAYVVAGILGLDTASLSVGYVTSWAKGDADKIRATAENVHRAVRTITDALVPAEADTEETAA